MPFHFSVQELLLILLIVILLFGVGRIGKIAGEMGKGIRSFRENLKSPLDDESGDGSQSKV